VPYLHKLVLRAVYDWPYSIESAEEDENPDLRASVRILNLLNDNPGLLPDLRDLELEGCYPPVEVLLQYIRKRQHSAGCTVLERLVLGGCSWLLERVTTSLAQELMCFSSANEVLSANQHRRQRDANASFGMEDT
jgi:hypothetical protein